MEEEEVDDLKDNDIYFYNRSLLNFKILFINIINCIFNLVLKKNHNNIK